MRKYVEETISGGTWIFLGNMVVSLTGFIFWFIITRLIGLENVGIASAIVTSSTIAVTLVSAGLNIAVVREIATAGLRGFIASVVLSSILGLLAGFISVPLVYFLGYNEYLIIAMLLALFLTLNITILSSLIGFGLFRRYFQVVAISSAVKLCVGVALALVGFKALAPLLGYLAYPVTMLLIIVFMTASFGNNIRKQLYVDRKDIKSLASLSLSNYPYMLSNQLLSMISVYLFAFLIGKPISTGTLYIAFIVALAISTIPNSLLNASLSLGTRKNTDPFNESFRIGLALTTPIIVLAITMPKIILRTINPDLIEGATTLQILLLTIAPLTALNTVLMRLNKEKDTRKIALIGTTRLLLLLTLLPTLTKALGINGAAVAYLLANILAIITITNNKYIIQTLAKLWSIHIIAMILSIILPLEEPLSAVVVTMASISILHLTRLSTLNELYNIFRIMIKTLARR